VLLQSEFRTLIGTKSDNVVRFGKPLRILELEPGVAPGVALDGVGVGTLSVCLVNCAKNPRLLNSNPTSTIAINRRDIVRKSWMYPMAPISRIATIHLTYDGEPVKSAFRSAVSCAVCPRTPAATNVMPIMPKTIGILNSDHLLILWKLALDYNVDDKAKDKERGNPVGLRHRYKPTFCASCGYFTPA
jgi:hypothetical protein